MKKPRCPSRMCGAWNGLENGVPGHVLGPGGATAPRTLAEHEQDEVETHRVPAQAHLAVCLSP